MSARLFLAAALLALLAPRVVPAEVGARLEVLEIAGEKLRGNPLGDPVARRVAMFVPPQYRAGQPLPIVYYLPGFGSSSEDFIGGGSVAARQLVEALAKDGLPLLLAVVDARNRWGGSQYLNSSAQGNYADYICDEIVPAVEARYTVARERRIIAGHSSGGYGALLLAMQRQPLFGFVVALSPDSEFEFTHRPLVEQEAVRRVTPAELAAWMSPVKDAPRPRDGLVELMLGLSAAYAPAGPGRFEWLYDARGQFQQRVWEKWLALDPLVIVRRDPRAFAPTQRIYLDGAEHDSFRANVGARHIAEALRERKVPCAFYESPGGHSDHLFARLQRGLAWCFDRPVRDLRRER